MTPAPPRTAAGLRSDVGPCANAGPGTNAELASLPKSRWLSSWPDAEFIQRWDTATTVVGYQSPKSRRWLVGAVISNAIVVAVCSTVQWTWNSSNTLSYSQFNAAALLPGVKGLLVLSLGREQSKRSGMQAMQVAGVIMSVVLCGGLAMSLSRAVLLALTVAAFLIGPLLVGISFRHRPVSWMVIDDAIDGDGGEVPVGVCDRAPKKRVAIEQAVLSQQSFLDDDRFARFAAGSRKRL